MLLWWLQTLHLTIAYSMNNLDGDQQQKRETVKFSDQKKNNNKGYLTTNTLAGISIHTRWFKDNRTHTHE